jgi:hypothetical protein
MIRNNHSRPSLHFAVLLVFTSQLCCFSQGVLNITFDGSPTQPSGTAYSVNSYSESGILFTPAIAGGQFGRCGGGISFFSENGTAYLLAALGDSLQFNFLDGQIFNLNSVDLAEYSTVVPNAVTVHFIGYHPDGSTVTQDFTTDGIIDGTGPLADFQTFQFNPLFSNLVRVEIPNFGWSLDNLVITPTPEPSTVWLGLLGGGLLFLLRRHTSH